MKTSLLELIPVSMIETLLSRAMNTGGDFAEIYLQRGRAQSVALEEEKVKTAGFGVSCGIGIRVISGTEVGYAYSDDLSTTALYKAAEVAGAIAKSGGQSSSFKVNGREVPDRYPIVNDPGAIELSKKIEMLQLGDRVARAYDKRISQVMGSFADATKEILIANSEGLLVDDLRTMCRLSFSTVASDSNGERRTGSHGGGGRVNFDFFDTFDPETVAREAARMSISQIGAIDCPAGQRTVVLSPGWSGILLHEAVGHGLEADFIHKGTSLYANQLGEKVASDLCTVIDNGEIPHRRGSLNIDDEGEVAQEKVLIENGVLKGFMADRLSGQILGTGSTGSGRRESYQCAPMPRMTNTYMAAGPHSHDEIIESVDDGLYCASFGGGQVDISNGNFVFEVREGYLIKNGKIDAPVKNATLIGVGPESLKNISMVGDNPTLDPGIGTCGKDGQSVPVGVGMPTVKIDNMTVGGTSQ